MAEVRTDQASLGILSNTKEDRVTQKSLTVLSANSDQRVIQGSLTVLSRTGEMRADQLSLVVLYQNEFAQLLDQASLLMVYKRDQNVGGMML